VIGVVLMLHGCGGGGSTTSNDMTETVSTTESKKLLIPLYSYPYEDNTWTDLIALKEKYPKLEIIAIVNQSNGDFTSVDTQYTTGIAALHDANITTVGYVYTGYANRNIDEVKQNIDSWANLYSSEGVAGIFFDEASRVAGDIDYYKTLSLYAKAKGLETIILNPGTVVDTAYISEGFATIIVTQEMPYSDAVAMSEYNTPTATTKLAMLFYESDANDMPALTCTHAKGHDFEYLYATDDGSDGNPWDSLSSYLEETAVLMLDGC
jgi:hypothetical protein